MGIYGLVFGAQLIELQVAVDGIILTNSCIIFEKQNFNRSEFLKLNLLTFANFLCFTRKHKTSGKVLYVFPSCGGNFAPDYNNGDATGWTWATLYAA